MLQRGFTAIVLFAAALGINTLAVPGLAIAADQGDTQAGQTPDPHPATVQLRIGPEVGEISVCSGVWVAPDKVLTAKHCFDTFPNGPVRVYPQNSQIRGTQPVARGLNWTTPGNKDIALLITEPTQHPVAEINLDPLTPSAPLQICGQNFIVNQSYDIKVDSQTIAGKANFCANVSTFSPELATKWQVPTNGDILATMPLSIEHGDSGGPLYNQAGQLVGVTSSKYSMKSSTGEQLVYNASTPLHKLAGWLAGLGVKPGAAAPNATPTLAHKDLPANVMRVAGPNRLATAAAVVDATPGAETLLITTGLVAADGLAATQLAGVTSAALALSNSRDHLDAEAINAITKYGFKRVVRIGGTVGISDADRTLITSRGMELVELVGSDRFDTAVKVAEYRDQLSGEKPHYLLLADGINFPDALTAGAAAGLSVASLILTSGDTLPEASAAYVATHADIPVLTVGGPAARASKNAGLQTKHDFAGADRYETAQLVAQSLASNGVNGLVFVSGRNFPDALAAGAYTVKQDSMLVLVPPAGTHPGMHMDLWNAAGQHGVIVGGYGVLSDQDVAYAVTP